MFSFNLRNYKMADKKDVLIDDKNPWLEGNQCAFQSKSKKENPYKPGTKEYDSWVSGYWRGLHDSGYSGVRDPKISVASMRFLPGQPNIMVDKSPQSLIKSISDLFQSYGKFFEDKGIDRNILQSLNDKNAYQLEQLFNELSGIVNDERNKSFTRPIFTALKKRANSSIIRYIDEVIPKILNEEITEDSALDFILEKSGYPGLPRELIRTYLRNRMKKY